MIYLLLFLLFLIVLTIFFINNYFKIAVVGNGPLTEEEIKEINKYNIIAVINKSKNGDKDIPIKATDLFLRHWGGGAEPWNFYGWNKDKNEFTQKPETLKTVKNIILLHSEKQNIENINKIVEKHTDKNIVPLSNWVLKDPIYTFNKKKYEHRTYSPSSGILTINYMLEKYPFHTIHIYGMNHTGREHNMKKEKEYIGECDRCITHKTWKDTYQP